MFRAPVPKAAVDEHGDLRSGEQDVRPSPRHPREGVVHPVPEPESVEFAAQEQFGLGVPLCCRAIRAEVPGSTPTSGPIGVAPPLGVALVVGGLGWLPSGCMSPTSLSCRAR